ncbi:MAG: hypothetical protein RMN51_06750 [Verrucomicrobiota bacterium]|nr:hypothetical protein [Limisphaera sp.]MDW8381790.1 hypothetical protein [Verrucomicrobiota bacterium]
MRRWWILYRLSAALDAERSVPSLKGSPETVRAEQDPESRALLAVHRQLMQMPRPRQDAPEDLVDRIAQAIREQTACGAHLADGCRKPRWELVWWPVVGAAVLTAAAAWWFGSFHGSLPDAVEARAFLQAAQDGMHQWAREVFHLELDPLQREWETTRRELQACAVHFWSSIP